ncbi:MAG: aminodeoxychorismate synthase component I [Armatimonadetes bacterium]|nr:aminodeoxychorismate synthase component I [Armatimonadota bacterium]
MSEPGLVLIQTREGWLRFRRPVERLDAATPAEVPALVRAAEAAVARGQWIAGYLAYEASPAFDPILATRPAGPLPVAWFGVYPEPERFTGARVPPLAPGGCTLGDIAPELTAAEHAARVERVRDYIATGDTYQVNLTHRLRAPFEGDPSALWARLLRSQRDGYAAYLDLGRWVVCSASPELFFELDGERVTSRPMKGTAPRGATLADDRALAAALAESVKDRAENLMIVDMVRNDLGRIAEVGSVGVPALFTVERYETVWQMTSTVTCRSRAPFGEMLAALFPCASITGAPKVRTMQIIRELEVSPRGVYTGAIGWLAPGRRAQFNVAIRTVVVDREEGLAEYGVGGGIVWDSRPDSEWRECLAKALILTRDRPAFELLETLLWDPDGGCFLEQLHLERMADSAEYFGFVWDEAKAREALHEAVAGQPIPLRVRLQWFEEGVARVTAVPFDPRPARHPWLVRLAAHPVDPGDPFLYHKTTHRAVYEAARAEQPGCDEVLLWNPRGELTEGTITNLVVELDGERLTPPTSCGLLPGTFRRWLVEQGQVREAVVRVEDLPRAERVWLINSVRRWIPAELASPD